MLLAAHIYTLALARPSAGSRTTQRDASRKADLHAAAGSGLHTSLGASDGAPSPSCLLLGSRLLAGRPDGAGRGLGQPVVPHAPHTAKGWGPPPPSPSRVDLCFVMCLPFGALAVHSRISGRITGGWGGGRRRDLPLSLQSQPLTQRSEGRCLWEQEPRDLGEVSSRTQPKRPSTRGIHSTRCCPRRRGTQSSRSYV